jgi:hypothetical protein
VRTRVLVLDVAGELEQHARTTLTALLTTRLGRFDTLDVVEKSSLTRLLDLEAEKQALDCAGDAQGGCLAEIAGALDVDAVAVATVGRIGGTLLFSLQIVDRTGRAIGRGTAQVSALDHLTDRVAAVVDDVGQQVTGAPPSAAPSGTPGSATTAGRLPVGFRQPLLIAGGAALGVGVLSLGLGVVPAVLYSTSASDLRSLRVRYVEEGGDSALVDQAATRQKDALAFQGLWNNAGIYAAWGGLLVGTAGGAAVAAALLLEEAP